MAIVIPILDLPAAYWLDYQCRPLYAECGVSVKLSKLLCCQVFSCTKFLSLCADHKQHATRTDDGASVS